MLDRLPRDVLRLLLALLDMHSLLQLRAAYAKGQLDAEVFACRPLRPSLQLSATEEERGLAWLCRPPGLLRRRLPAPRPAARPLLGFLGLGVRVREQGKAQWRALPGCEPPSNGWSPDTLFETLHLLAPDRLLAAGHTVCAMRLAPGASTHFEARLPAPPRVHNPTPTRYCTASVVLPSSPPRLVCATNDHAFEVFDVEPVLRSTGATFESTSLGSGVLSLVPGPGEETLVSLSPTGLEWWDLTARASVRSVRHPVRLYRMLPIAPDRSQYALAGMRHVALIDLRDPAGVLAPSMNDPAEEHHFSCVLRGRAVGCAGLTQRPQVRGLVAGSLAAVVTRPRQRGRGWTPGDVGPAAPGARAAGPDSGRVGG